jgi:hypothetical protein
MSLQTIALTENTTSNYFITFPISTAQSKTKVFSGNGYHSVNIVPSDIASLFCVGELVYSEMYQTMIASEKILARDWEHPDEDKAWANL